MPGARLRWTLVFTAATLEHLEERGIGADFMVPPTGLPEDPGTFSESMRLCVSARISDDDEVRSYRAWRRGKGER